MIILQLVDDVKKEFSTFTYPNGQTDVFREKIMFFYQRGFQDNKRDHG